MAVVQVIKGMLCTISAHLSDNMDNKSPNTMAVKLARRIRGLKELSDAQNVIDLYYFINYLNHLITTLSIKWNLLTF